MKFIVTSFGRSLKEQRVETENPTKERFESDNRLYKWPGRKNSIKTTNSITNLAVLLICQFIAFNFPATAPGFSKRRNKTQRNLEIESKSFSSNSSGFFWIPCEFVGKMARSCITKISGSVLERRRARFCAISRSQIVSNTANLKFSLYVERNLNRGLAITKRFRSAIG